MSQEWLAPTVVSSAIAGGVALATHLSSQRLKRSENREDIRSEAFAQAKDYYTDVIERQEQELESMRKSIESISVRLREAEMVAENARAAVRMMRQEIDERDEQIADLRMSLARRAAEEKRAREAEQEVRRRESERRGQGDDERDRP